jgi:hypothetical protein
MVELMGRAFFYSILALRAMLCDYCFASAIQRSIFLFSTRPAFQADPVVSDVFWIGRGNGAVPS